jgi:ABC-type glutathione transport system ATPase component
MGHRAADHRPERAAPADLPPARHLRGGRRHELRLAPNTVSTLVGRLAEQDLLQRERSLPDSRSVRLTITDKARRRLEEWRNLRAELASEVLAALPEADRRGSRLDPAGREHREDGAPMSLDPGPTATGQTPEPVEAATGTQPAGSRPGLALAEPAVSCSGATYRFGDHVAVDQVDLSIQPGETFGLLGPNGAGKTTTIRMLVTLLKPMDGRISVFGADAASRPRWA